MEYISSNSLPPRKRLIIVPAYNEVASIANVVKELLRTLPDFDILVIDDGSIDGTAEVVPEGAVVIKLPFNLGIGGAMQTGFRYAATHGYDLTVQVDGDGQHLPSEVGKIVNQLENNNLDMVIGSRFLEPGKYKQKLTRLIGIHILRTLLFALTTGKTITDCTSGFRAVNRNVINCFAYWYPDDYPEPEVVLLMIRSGFNLAEVSVEMAQREGGKTSIPFWKGVFYTIKVMAALVLDMIRDPWPNRRLYKNNNISKIKKGCKK